MVAKDDLNRQFEHLRYLNFFFKEIEALVRYMQPFL